MGIGVVCLRQIKIPVTDLVASVRWYTDLFGMEHSAEFVEQGSLRGVVLADHDAGFVIGLREREYCASKPVLDGYDVAAFQLGSLDDVDALAARCDADGIRRSEIQNRGEHGVALDVFDPDGTVLRFVAGPFIGAPGEFLGLSFDENGIPTRYDEPRMPLP